jgi:hypothetical protein
MKTNLFTIIFFLVSFISSAQINLEHTFSGASMYSPVNTNNQTMYYNFDATSSILNIYDNNFSLYKTITITPPSGYKTPAFTGGISTKIFNYDDLVEFCFSFTSIANPYESKLLLYNENLQVLKDFGNRISLYFFKTVDNVTKCSVTGFTINGSVITYYQDIYHLPGNLPVDVNSELPIIDEQLPYPNPTASFIVIPLSLKENETSVLNIFNQNGQVMDSKTITGYENRFIYNVKSLSPGVYFYQYNKIHEKFIVQ